MQTSILPSSMKIKQGSFGLSNFKLCPGDLVNDRTFLTNYCFKDWENLFLKIGQLFNNDWLTSNSNCSLSVSLN